MSELAVPWWGAAWRQYRLERRMFWRNPSAAFFGVLLPLGLLAIFGAVFAGRQEDLDVIVPGIAGLSIMSATFTSLAYNLTTLRERGILKRLRGTPLPTSAYLAGLAGNAIANAALQLALVIVAGNLVLGVSWPQDWVALGVFAGAGVICFALLGVALAHAIPNPESAPAYVNAVFLPQILIAGVFYDASEAPSVIRDIAQALPLTHLIDGLSGAMIDGESVATNAVALLALAVWAAVGAVLAVRGFSWEARRLASKSHCTRSVAHDRVSTRTCQRLCPGAAVRPVQSRDQLSRRRDGNWRARSGTHGSVVNDRTGLRVPAGLVQLLVTLAVAGVIVLIAHFAGVPGRWAPLVIGGALGLMTALVAGAPRREDRET